MNKTDPRKWSVSAPTVVVPENDCDAAYDGYPGEIATLRKEIDRLRKERDEARHQNFLWILRSGCATSGELNRRFDEILANLKELKRRSGHPV